MRVALVANTYISLGIYIPLKCQEILNLIYIHTYLCTYLFDCLIMRYLSNFLVNLLFAHRLWFLNISTLLFWKHHARKYLHIIVPYVFFLWVLHDFRLPPSTILATLLCLFTWCLGHSPFATQILGAKKGQPSRWNSLQHTIAGLLRFRN